MKMVGLIFLAFAVSAQAAPAPARLAETIAGLAAPADLIVDRWGIPHIFAANDHDAFFLQGWNVARDRLWQIDLWRKRGLGRLSASFGPSFLAKDEGARLLLYRGDVNSIWAEFGADAKAETEAFAAGINSYIDAVLAGLRALPVEFRVTHSVPERWSAEDVVRIRSHGLSGNVADEVMRARVACAVGLEFDKYREWLQPDGWTTHIPAGLDPCVVSSDLLRLYLLGTEPVRFAADGVMAADSGDVATRVAALAVNAAGEGSNNWAIAPSHSASGRPVLANDPHRAHSLPSLRYIAHLNAPGLNVIGAGEPGLPGLSTGHNDRIAFGLTISEVDQEDLYVYDLDPADPDRYRYRDGFEAMTKIEELIPVKGAPPHPVTLRFTRHGPVLAVDEAKAHAFALRSVWALPGSIPYYTALLYQKARNWRDFTLALAHWNSPPLNHVFADIEGNIGWTIGAAAPVRPNWDGLLPVPGDGTYEWNGMMNPALFPRQFNPRAGYVATANDFNLPADFLRQGHNIGFEWSDVSRITRIREILGAKPRLTLQDTLALQTDTTTTMGRRFVAQLPASPPPDGSAARAAAQLRDWNCRLDSDSAAAALYEIWISRTLPPAMMAELVPQAALALVGDGSLEAILAVLEGKPAYHVPVETRVRLDQALWSSLGAAWDQTALLLGPDPRYWAWGKLHHSLFESVVKPMAEPALGWKLALRSLPMGGSDYSVMAAGYRADDFAVNDGASVRLAHDVGHWDNSRATNSPGQSGDPDSPFYGDLLPLWAAGDTVPLLFTRPAIEQAAARIYRLTPG